MAVMGLLLFIASPAVVAGVNFTEVMPPFPPQSRLPSASQPFLLVHLPKCAGTSMRAAVAAILRAAGLPNDEQCIPGFGGMSPRVLSTAQCWRRYRMNSTTGEEADPMVQPPLVAVAGHFNYLTSIRSIEKRNHLPLNATIPCFSMIRDPIERLVSYYYWFHDVKERTPSLLQNLGPEEGTKVLSGLGIAQFYYHQFPLLTLFGGLKQKEVERHDESAMEVAAEIAKETLKRCVIGDTDDEGATQELTEHFFPWLAPKMRPDTMPHSNTHRSPSSPRSAPVPPEMEVLIRKHYRHEMELYDYALELHKAQVAFVRSQLY